jgi:nitrite reductase/ring-hydroxylating ferredoxin subunit
MLPEIVSGEVDEGPFLEGWSYIRPAIVVKENGFILPVIHGHVGDFSGGFHYHLDMRFVPSQYMMNTRMLMGVIGESVRARFECVMTHVPPIAYTFSKRGSASHRLLERRQKDKKCHGKVCPHQGCDLTAVKPNVSDTGKEVLTCPCHGLQWDTTTGELVRRRISLKVKPLDHKEEHHDA